jgi:S1-C subfamily serine protease
MEPYPPPLPDPRRPISSARHAAPPPPPRRPGPATAAFPARSYPYAPGPPRRPGTPSRRRHRRTRWALAALTAAVAIAGGGIWARGATTTTQATRRSAAATPVRKKDLSTAAIADQDDAAIVDVVTTLGYQNGQAAGTGIVLTSSGEILTNHHVIQGSTSITVKVSNSSQTYKATVVGFDATDDIAVLQAEGASGLTTAPLGNSAAVTIDQSVVAIGNALNKPGLPTVTEGTVTQLGRSISVSGDNGTVEQLKDLLETSAPLQPGNSGGPLLDTAGQVVGINTAASAGNIPNGGTTDGYAIPISDALTIAHQIESGHSTATVHIGASPFLGIRVGGGSRDVGGGAAPGSSNGSGVLVAGVESGTPAESAGIAAGDQIIAVAGTTVSSQSELTAALSAKHPGDTITITWVDQSNAQHQTTIRLATGPTA